MSHHEFLFSPGRWVGGGKITINGTAELIRFYTNWVIEDERQGKLAVQQKVEMHTISESAVNRFLVYDIMDHTFAIDRISDLHGTTRGSGIIDKTTIAWEFRSNNRQEGFEVYELQDNGDYMVHAEYSSFEQFRTVVDGRIWKKLANA